MLVNKQVRYVSHKEVADLLKGMVELHRRRFINHLSLKHATEKGWPDFVVANALKRLESKE